MILVTVSVTVLVTISVFVQETQISNTTRSINFFIGMGFVDDSKPVFLRGINFTVKLQIKYELTLMSLIITDKSFTLTAWVSCTFGTKQPFRSSLRGSKIKVF